MIPPVVASERGTAQTIHVYGMGGVVGLRRCMKTSEKNFLERKTIEHDSLRIRTLSKHSSILSSAEHEEFCVNLPGPSGKAKYSRETDSEPVP